MNATDPSGEPNSAANGLSRAGVHAADHTPGPWRISELGVCVVESVTGRMVGECFQDGGMMGAEDQANARLITTAPELLAALNALLGRYTAMVNSGDCGYWDCEEDAEVVAARAAIAKATRNAL